jgi:cation diffusion facilitator CzcD-associated flavoprotein CzcO
LLSDLATSFGEEFVKKHFTPSYNPWEQRFCIAPDGDFFRALKKKSASIITGKINKFTKNGLLMESGEEIESDIIVMATGLRLQLFGGIAIDLDGNPLDQSNTLAYKGMMLNKVPNFVSVFGYLSASWTLRSDKICQHFCRILKEMYKRGSIVCTPTYDPTIRKSDKISSFHDGFSSGYLQRAEADNGGLWGRCVDRHPWKSNKWLLSDQWMLQYSPAIEKEMILS